MSEEKYVPTLGEIVDMPQKEFEEAIVNQEVNVGTISSLILSLESAFNELKCRKDEIISRCLKKELDKDSAEVMRALNGCYLELNKLENKIVYLKDRKNYLLNSISLQKTDVSGV